MKRPVLEIIEDGGSVTINGADIPRGAVFTARSFCRSPGGENRSTPGLFISSCYTRVPGITIIRADGLMAGFVYEDPSQLTFRDYKVVNKITVEV